MVETKRNRKEEGGKLKEHWPCRLSLRYGSKTEGRRRADNQAEGTVTTQPALLTSDYFVAPLGAIPPETGDGPGRMVG